MEQRRSFPTPVARHANTILGSLPGRLDIRLHSQGSNPLNNANILMEMSLELKKPEVKHVFLKKKIPITKLRVCPPKSYNSGGNLLF